MAALKNNLKSNYSNIESLKKDFRVFEDNNEEIFDEIEELSDYETLDLSDDEITSSLENVKELIESLLNIKIDFGKYTNKSLKEISDIDSSYYQWITSQANMDRPIRNINSLIKYY